MISPKELTDIILFHIALPDFEQNRPPAARRSELFNGREFVPDFDPGSSGPQSVFVERRGRFNQRIFIVANETTSTSNDEGKVLTTLSIKAGDTFLWLIDEVLLPFEIDGLCLPKGATCECGLACCSQKCLGSCKSSGFYLPFIFRRCA